MAAGKEIRGKIKSVENTKKITKAMEMVAASKMRKAQDRMRAARPYAEKVRAIAGNLSKANPEYVHPFMKANDAKTAGYVVVTTDKGLCGGLNTNVLRAVTNALKARQADGQDAQVVAIGNKGLGFMNRIGAKVVSSVTGLGDTPHLEKLIGPVKVLLDAYTEGRINRRPSLSSSCRCRLPICKRTPPATTGTTSTNPTRSPSLTTCCCATSRRRSIRLWRKTWRPSNRPAWWP